SAKLGCGRNRDPLQHQNLGVENCALTVQLQFDHPPALQAGLQVNGLLTQMSSLDAPSVHYWQAPGCCGHVHTR
ncbi:hypothetical protein AB6809_35950, partial [Paraburkholderia sp. RCC_158]|uniref:hypothetical protein n=1 Tax=Paraburkholderia sp. RCC_158 TaxID=3239220 RepID=UPI0035237745